MKEINLFCVLIFLITALYSVNGASNYYGKYIGPLKGYHHAVEGQVYAVDARTLHIRDFSYDGQGPAAYFWVGSSAQPDASGYALRDDRQSSNELKNYRKNHITLTLPEGKTLSQIKWFSVWCESAAVNFGDIRIPKGFDFPRPQKIGQLSGIHAVSSDPIVIVDAQTLLVPNFSYDGEAPDAKFWVGVGQHPSPRGIRVPDENGKMEPLRRYNKKTIVLTLPGELTVFEIGHFGVWCEAFTVDFGHIQIPSSVNIPPSLKMLGVSPQSKLNCEVLHDSLAFEVRWAIAGDSIVLQLVSKLKFGEYMSFGLSGDPLKNQMVGADVVTAWVDQETLNGYAVDYYLADKSQCAGSRGSCPDLQIQDNSDSVRLLNAALVNGYSIVTYQRPLKSHDELDHDIYTNQSQAIIWAIGPLNSKQEVSYHSITSKKNILIDFGRTPFWNCPIPEGENGMPADQNGYQEQSSATQEQSVQDNRVKYIVQSPPTPAPAPKTDAWEIPPIECNEPDDGVLYAQMGPTGGKHGYPAITGHVGWGISWYINGLLIPVINVVRGRTYTFIVEGGIDPDIPAKYHPFYITDDPIGGYYHKTKEEKDQVKIFAGVKRDANGELVPSDVGRLCNWTPDPEQPDADEFVSFGAYQRTLSLICDHGDPGIIRWTPDKNTPDTVYYQCFTHRYLGWKINVLDGCDIATESSEQVTTKIRSDDYIDQSSDSELDSRPSIKVSTRVKPDGSSSEVSSSEIINNFHKDIPNKFKDNLKNDFSKKSQVPEFILNNENNKFNGYNQHEIYRMAMEQKEKEIKEKQEKEIKHKREQQNNNNNKYEVKEDNIEEKGDNKQEESQHHIVIEQSLEPITIHQQDIQQQLEIRKQQEKQSNINQSIQQHFEQNLDLNTEKSVPIAYVVNGNQQSTNQPFLLTTLNQNYISSSQNPQKQPMVVYPINQQETRINPYILQQTTPYSIQKQHNQQQQQFYSTINDQHLSTQKYGTTPGTPIYLQNPMSITRVVGQIRGNPQTQILTQIQNKPNYSQGQTSFSQGPPTYSQGPLTFSQVQTQGSTYNPIQISPFAQGHRVQQQQQPQFSQNLLTPQNNQYSSIRPNYNPYQASNLQGYSQSPLINQQSYLPNNVLSNQSGKDNMPYKTGYILLQNKNPNRPVNVNVYKRPISNPNTRRPNIIIKKPIYKNKLNPQSPQSTKHIMLVKPVNGHNTGAASSISQVVITPSKLNAETYPTVASKKVTVTYSTSSAQQNLNKIKPVLPLLVAGDTNTPIEITHSTKIQKKSGTIQSKPNIINTIPLNNAGGGFNPNSVIIESGFKPIINNNNDDIAQRRMSNSDEVEYIDETTITNIEQTNNYTTNILDENKQTEYFEPIFIPSPPDQQKLRKEKKPTLQKPVRQVVVRKRVNPYPASNEQERYSKNNENRKYNKFNKVTENNDNLQTYFLPPSGPIYGLPKHLNKNQDKLEKDLEKKDLLHITEEKVNIKKDTKLNEKKQNITKDDNTKLNNDNTEIKKLNNLKDTVSTNETSTQLSEKYKNHKYEEVEKINNKLKDNDDKNIEIDISDENSKDTKTKDEEYDSTEEIGRNERRLKIKKIKIKRSPHHTPEHKENGTKTTEEEIKEHSHEQATEKNTNSGSQRHTRSADPHHTPDHHGDVTELDEHQEMHNHEIHDDHHHDAHDHQTKSLASNLSAMPLLFLIVIQLFISVRT